MSTTTEVYAALLRQGVSLRCEEGELRVRAARGVMTDALREDIRAHKAGLMAFVQAHTPLPPVPTPSPTPSPAHHGGPTAATTHGRYPQPRDRDLVHLGPILPACPVCRTMQYWHNHATDVWECWSCVPPVVHALTNTGASVISPVVPGRTEVS
jgi:hypothetical protein